MQQSAYPDAYDKWQPVAAAVVGKVKGVTCTSSGQPGGAPFVADSTWASVIALERSRLGTPYSWGGGSVNGPGLGFGPGAGVVGWDCSSFQQWAIYQATGGKVDITRTTASQTTKYESTPYLFAKGPPLQPGDLLYWGVGSASHHVALYSGDGMILEETQPGFHSATEPAADRLHGGAAARPAGPVNVRVTKPVAAQQRTPRARSVGGLVVDWGVAGVLLHRLDALQRTGPRLVRLTGGDDLPIAGLEPEPELAGRVLVQLKPSSHDAALPCRR